jgi:hypothetical protein
MAADTSDDNGLHVATVRQSKVGELLMGGV